MGRAVKTISSDIGSGPKPRKNRNKTKEGMQEAGKVSKPKKGKTSLNPIGSDTKPRKKETKGEQGVGKVGRKIATGRSQADQVLTAKQRKVRNPARRAHRCSCSQVRRKKKKVQKRTALFSLLKQLTELGLSESVRHIVKWLAIAIGGRILG